MKRKRITFSSSGGTPAMAFLTYLTENFGAEEIELIAARIAAACRGTRLIVEASFDDGTMVLSGNTATRVGVKESVLMLSGENIGTEEGTITIM